MTRRGSSFLTAHSAFWTQGWICRHGFKHSPLKQACLLGQSPSVMHPGSSITGSGTDKRTKMNEILSKYLQIPYLDHRQSRMGYQCNLGSKCKCLGGCVVYNQQTEHMHMGQRISHFHISVCPGNLSQWGIRIVDIDHMGFLGSPLGSDRKLDGVWAYRSHLPHTLGTSKDLCILGHSMLQSGDIHHQLYSQLQ